MADVPHFSLPFRFGGPQAAVVEQDSLDEIADCVYAILLCPQGFRVELPGFGVPDLTFQTQPLDLGAVRSLVEAWEPRSATTFTQQPDRLDELIVHARMSVSLRTEE